MQCCVQRFTLLEVIVDKQMINQNRFLSPELSRLLKSLGFEIIRRLKSVPPRKGFYKYIFSFLDSEYNMSDVQCKHKY